MSEIKRNTDPLTGPPDGVEADIQTVVTLFDRAGQKKVKGATQRTIRKQTNASCHVLCSYSDGLIGFSVRDKDLMFSIRLDELFEILKAAADASGAFRDTIPEMNMLKVPTQDAPDYQDRRDTALEQVWKELEDVPFDEADSPHGLVLAVDWYTFPKGTDRGDIWGWFDENYSKGIEHLINRDE